MPTPVLLLDFKMRWQQLLVSQGEETSCSCHTWESGHLDVLPFLLSWTDTLIPWQEKQNVPLISAPAFPPQGLQPHQVCVTTPDTLQVTGHLFSADFLSIWLMNSLHHSAVLVNQLLFEVLTILLIIFAQCPF